MDWNSYFESSFFNSWYAAGLPHYEAYTGHYVDLREHRELPGEWIKNYGKILPKVDASQLYSVYGFGAAFGKVISVMISADPEHSKQVSDWCGRFNLGISLFDHICDAHNGLDTLADLPVIARLTSKGFQKSRKLNQAEALLENLATGVLMDIEKLGFGKERFLIDMREMLEAESFVATYKISTNPDLKGIETALYNKSVLPFIVMAKYTATYSNHDNPFQISQVERLGEALGYCYWFIDDARDVWEDLKASQWNLFMVRAARKKSSLFKDSHRDLQSRLNDILLDDEQLIDLCKDKVYALRSAIKVFNLPEKTETEMLGLIAASLWLWWKY